MHVRWHLPFELEIRDDGSCYPNVEVWVDYPFHNELSLSTRLGLGPGYRI